MLGKRWTLFEKSSPEYFSFYLHVIDNCSITYFSFHQNVAAIYYFVNVGHRIDAIAEGSDHILYLLVKG